MAHSSASIGASSVLATKSARFIAADAKMRHAARVAFAKSRAVLFAQTLHIPDAQILRASLVKALAAQDAAILAQRRRDLAQQSLAAAWRGSK